MSSELAAGHVIEGRYRLVHPLAEGGMGVVWAAARLDGGPPVALKLLRPAAVSSPAIYRRFLREARAAAAVRHPSVVTVHEVMVLEDGCPVIVMDLLQGESLRGRLDRERLLPLPDLARILLPVISAVGSAHALGIVHRDLKPENIFLLDPGRGQVGSARVKVLDFGIAKLTALEGEAARTAGLTDPGVILGTPYYMAPEQVLGAQDVDYRADIWSLGVILYEALTGVRPTEAGSVGKILKRIIHGTITPVRLVSPHIPKNIVDLIDRTLTVERELRPTLQELGKVLARYGNVTFRPFGPPASLPPPPPSDPPPGSTGASDVPTVAQAEIEFEVGATLHEGSASTEAATTLVSDPEPPSEARTLSLEEHDARLFDAAATLAPEAGSAPVAPEPAAKADGVTPRGSTPPPPPPKTSWTTMVVCVALIAVGSALILLWQRP